MNKEKFSETLLNKTNYSKEQVEIIDEIIGKHFVIGRKNKDKMIEDFMNELSITKEEANDLYNTCMEIIMTSVKDKIKHPFSKKD